MPPDDATLAARWVATIPMGELEAPAGATRTWRDPDSAGCSSTVIWPLPERSSLHHRAVDAGDLEQHHRGGFLLTEELGAGGMGSVWRGVQASLRRDVAVKRLHGGTNDREAFVAEAMVAGFLDHPNILPVHALAEDETGELFMAMKLARGTPWSALLRPDQRGQSDPSGRNGLEGHLRILLAVCNAVAFAHSKGILHRDLKPENVMVGAFGEVLVVDWGLAVAFGDEERSGGRARHASELTNPGGTPAYMAPEIACADGTAFGPWTDVYLLGAILHELLTGHPPHHGPSLLAVLRHAAQSPEPIFPDGIPEELAATCRHALARDPADRPADVASFRDAIADWLDHRESLAITDRADAHLQRAEKASEADQRYAAFADAVAAYRQALDCWQGNRRAALGEDHARRSFAAAALAGGDLGLARTQAAACHPPPSQLLARIDAAAQIEQRRRRGQHRLKVAVVVATAMTLLVLAIATVWIAREQQATAEALATAQRERDAARDARQAESRQRERAEDALAAAQMARRSAETAQREAEQARDQAQREVARKNEISDFLASLLRAPDPTAGGAGVTLLEVLKDVDTRLDAEISDPRSKAHLWAMLATTFSGLAADQRAKPAFDRALDLHLEHFGQVDDQTLRTAYEIVNHAQRVQDLPWGAAAIERLITAAKAAGKGDAPGVLWLQRQQAEIAADLGDLEQAESLLSEGISQRERLFGVDNPSTLITRASRAWVWSLQGRYPQAELELETVHRLLERHYGAEHAETRQVLEYRILTAERSGDHERALDLMDRLVGALDGAPRIERLRKRFLLGRLLFKLGQEESAVSVYLDAYPDLAELLPPNHPDRLARAADTVLLALRTGKRQAVGSIAADLRAAAHDPAATPHMVLIALVGLAIADQQWAGCADLATALATSAQHQDSGNWETALWTAVAVEALVTADRAAEAQDLLAAVQDDGSDPRAVVTLLGAELRLTGNEPAAQATVRRLIAQASEQWPEASWERRLALALLNGLADGAPLPVDRFHRPGHPFRALVARWLDRLQPLSPEPTPAD